MKYDEKKIEESHQRFKNEFGIHFKDSESELELVGGFLEDELKQYAEHMVKKERDRIVKETR